MIIIDEIYIYTMIQNMALILLKRVLGKISLTRCINVLHYAYLAKILIVFL